ncbi:arsenate reductase (glutaredoxin) [Pseudomonadota bacterium]
MNAQNSDITIYHNPKCSKSRQTLELIQEKSPTVIEYLKTPPTPEQLDQILNMLGLQPRELMRKGEQAYADNNLNDESLSRDALIRIMTENPILIERPIVIANNRAKIGRPPESVLEIL